MRFHYSARRSVSPSFFRLLLLAACISAAPAACPALDDAPQRGRPPERIVSLAPEATEIICLLGAEDRLVGVTHLDGHFAGCAGKPIMGSPASPNLDAIERAGPDLIIADADMAEEFARFPDIPVMPWETGGGLREAWRKIQMLGRILCREAQAGMIVERERELLEILRTKMARIPPGKRLRGVFVHGRDDIQTVSEDNTPYDILGEAGILCPKGVFGAGEIDIAEWLDWNPEVILAESRDREFLSSLLNRPEWNSVPAVQQHQVYYFPASLTRRAAGHVGYLAAWLASMIYTDVFADPGLFVRREEKLADNPLWIDLPYVKNARIAESRIGDFTHRTLLLDFVRPQNILSTVDGYMEAVTTVGNSSSPTPMWAVNHQIGMDASRANVFRILDLDEHRTSLLFTGADMNNLAECSMESDGIRVVALATAGVEGNALRMSRDIGAYVEPGTINVILLSNRRLSPGAMANAIVSVTEAKTAALWDMDIRSAQTPRQNPATGTGTDSVIVVQGEGGDARWVGGHVKLGQLIAEATYKAVQSALLKQNGLVPVRHSWLRLAERRIHLEHVFRSEPGSPFMRRLNALILKPRYRGFVESAMALDDALEMGQFSEPELFEDWALAVAGEIAGKEAERLIDLEGVRDIPPLLGFALRAFATGLAAGDGE